ncbi:hypothetical protein CpB0690 [Chlamydia pneumoniae TW-183]|uniref:Uncharacterized protein n=2 Tax=Chlamydia pneumoniae TaxID=83558 RepID=Q9Z7P0_CHLPN|nr:hypothetical protein [Chlamydia pneumoniae]AAD18803.1 hypothetical protein CPn_0664 [Chlamydia pneumoniae CWL029]AAF37969.1 hypothetical protein CP_0083 [Chlamydia pneumoniae AR39]AAP98619.1 hypothetical protein CpB0690 [Chlamydia pneumoniae TW-183]ACZ32548.1 hypothetical protein CPK_ORF00064 [Chlamydia pneumoniae LPCoLN]ETR80572.1 hypothetical protein X556_0098 [Chlamydia pneumoniae B21]
MKKLIALIGIFLVPIKGNTNKEHDAHATVLKAARAKYNLFFVQDVFPVHEVIEPISPDCLVHYEGWV